MGKRKARRNRYRAPAVDGASAAALGSSSRDRDLSVVVVHGIGNQRPGDVLASVGDSIVARLAEVASSNSLTLSQTSTVHPSNIEAVGESPRAYEIIVRGRDFQSQIRLVELVWSQIYERPRLSRVLRWALPRLPALALLLSPDQRDAAALDGSPHSGGDADWAIAARLFLRIIFAGALIAFLIWSFSRYLIPSLLLALMAFLSLAAYLKSPRNVVGHVEMAATNSAELRDVTASLLGHVQEELDQSKKLLLIGHSQGGYLAHRIVRALPSESRKRVHLVGVGSGIKPIVLLEQMNRPIVRIAAWLTVGVGVLAAFGSVWLSQYLPSISSSVRNLFISGMQLGFPGTLSGTETAVSAGPEVLLDEINANLADMMNDLAARWPAVSLYFLVLLASAFIGRRVWERSETGEPLVDELVAGSWIEYSTYHDFVGRMLQPELPDARSIAIATSSHPVFDHTTYFGRSSILPLGLAQTIAQLCGFSTSSVWREASDSMLAQSSRWRGLRLSLVVAIGLALFLVVEAATDGGPLDSLVVVSPIVVALLLVLGLVGSRIERKRFSRCVDATAASLMKGQVPALPSRPIPWRLRVLPVLGLTLVSFLVFFQNLAIAVWLESSWVPMPNWIITNAAVLALGGSAILLWLVVAGYRASPRILLSLAGANIAGYVVFAGTVDYPFATAVFAAPGGALAIVAGLATVAVTWLLRAGRVGRNQVTQPPILLARPFTAFLRN